jgi:hypothetical protein
MSDTQAILSVLAELLHGRDSEDAHRLDTIGQKYHADAEYARVVDLLVLERAKSMEREAHPLITVTAQDAEDFPLLGMEPVLRDLRDMIHHYQISGRSYIVEGCTHDTVYIQVSNGAGQRTPYRLKVTPRMVGM